MYRARGPLHAIYHPERSADLRSAQREILRCAQDDNLDMAETFVLSMEERR